MAKDRKSKLKVFFAQCILLSYFLLLMPQAIANTRDQAFTIHTRITGVPPKAATLNSMEQKIEEGNHMEAAMEAMENPNFFNTTLKNFISPWTNEDRDVFVDLNDYTATVIGMIRDDIPFNTVLTADILYVSSSSNIPDYAQDNNDHYIAIQENNIDLSNTSEFVRTTQSSQEGSPLSPATASGVVTTRAAASAFFKDGTNRAMFRFTSINYLCKDLEQLQDVTRPPNYIRQDVSRSPGGDSTVFLNNCIGCHSGMDGLSKAYAYYNWDNESEQLIFNSGQVQDKNLINANVYPLGYITTDDTWENHWRKGPNALLGWEGNASTGSGLKSMNSELANSRQFSVCQVEKTFEHVCLRSPTTGADKLAVERIATVFENNQYNMKRVFAETAIHCMGE